MSYKIKQRIGALVIIACMMFSIVLCYSADPVYASSGKTKYVISEVVSYPLDGSIGLSYTYSYKKGLISSITVRDLGGYSPRRVDRYYYNKKGKYTKEKSSGGRTEKLKRNKKGRVIFDGFTKYKYNSKGFCTSSSFQMHYGTEITKYKYNRKGKLIKLNSTRIYYDKKGNPSQLYGGGDNMHFTNYYDGNRIIECDMDGAYIIFEYKKVKVPSKFSKKVKHQQEWIRFMQICGIGGPSLVAVN